MGGKQKLIAATAAVAIAGGAIAVMQAQRPARPRTNAEAAPPVAAVAAAPVVPSAPSVGGAEPAAVARAASKVPEPAKLATRSAPGAAAAAAPEREHAFEAGEGPKRELMESASPTGARGKESERDRWYKWFYGQRSYPAARIPPNARANAIAHAKAHNTGKTRLALPTWTAIGPSTIPDGQTDTSVGPPGNVSGRVSAIAVDPTDASVVYAGGAQGGVWKSTDGGATWTPKTDYEDSLAIGDITIDPTNHNTLYVGTGEPNGSCDSYYGAGILKSTDGGETWVTLAGSPGGPFYGQSISKVIVNPNNPAMVWASTALAFISSATEQCAFGPVSWNGALWRSTDAGVTWALQDVPTGAAQPNNRIHDMVLDPTNSANLYVAVRNNGIWKSTNADDTSGTPAFTRLGTSLGSLEGGLPDLSIANPPIRRVTLGIGAQGQTLYAAFEDGFYSTLFALYKSTDAGATWWHVDNGINGVAQKETGPNLHKTSGSAIPVSAIGHRVLVEDAGGLRELNVVDVPNPTHFKVDQGINDANVRYSIGFYPLACGSVPGTGQCFYDMTIGVDPTDSTEQTVYIGGNPQTYNLDLSGGGGHYLWKSTDGGSSWASISQGDATNGGIHTDDHEIVFGGGYVFDGNDGGIWKSSDAGASWANLNTNIAITQFQGVALHPTDKAIVLGGTQDNGTNLLNPALETPPSWFHSDFGDGGIAVIDGGSPTRMLHTYYNVAGFYGPSKVTDGGAGGPGSWPFVGTYYGYGPQFYNGMNPLDDVSFYAPMALNKATTPNVVYFGSNKVYRAADPKPACCDAWGTGPASACGYPNALVCPNAPSWTPVSPVLVFNPGNYLSAIAPLPYLVGGKEVVYTGSSDGAMFVTQDLDASATATWTEVDDASTPGRFITEIFVDPADATGNTAYATFSGFGFETPSAPGHVFKTTNGLSGTATWTDISGDLPDIPVNTLSVTPAGIIVGTDIGPFLSTDDGASWTLIDSGHPHVSVFQIKYNGQTGQVVSATHGRGMFELQADLCKHGDVNGDGNVDVLDVFYYINYLFAGGAAPTCPTSQYVNGDNVGDIVDVFYLINYLFAGGPAPI